MKLLLDTHIWLWSLLQPQRLKSSVAAALQSNKSELWLSPISLWELTVLAGKGRIVLSVSAEEWIKQAFAVKPLKEAPLTSTSLSRRLGSSCRMGILPTGFS